MNAKNDEQLTRVLSDLNAARDALEMVVHGKDPDFSNATRVLDGIASGNLASYVGKYVIVRTEGKGTWAGVLESNLGWSVELTQARRMYMWVAAVKGSASLSGVALNGVDPAMSEIHEPLERVWVNCGREILPVTDVARASIDSTPPKLYKKDTKNENSN